MGSRTKETKAKDTIRGTRAELLNAIAWVIKNPEDIVFKSTNEDDWKKHIDWIAYKKGVKNGMTWDTKARRFETYGKGIEPDDNFVAEIENRNSQGKTKTGSIYGKQKYMSFEIAGYFVYILTKEVREYVEDWVLAFPVTAQTMDSVFESIYTFDDGAKITGLAFSRFKTHMLPIPEEFHARQFDYTKKELVDYIDKHKLNIILND